MGKIKLALALILFLMLLHPAGARDGEGMRVVPAQEILDKIERGEPVEYDHVIAEGDLDLGRLELPKRRANRTYIEVEYLGLSEDVMLVSSSIRLNDSAINGNTSFSNARFINPVDFSGSHLNGTADFRGSAFNSHADFDKSAFKSTAEFAGSTFNDYADFGDSFFNDNADFSSSTFRNRVNFDHSTFNGYASFWDSFFGRYTSFHDSVFSGNTYFNDSAFNGGTYFYDSDFSGYVSFRNSFFNNDAGFWDSTFKSHASFLNSTFNNDAGFWKSSFNGCDFQLASFNQLAVFHDVQFNEYAAFSGCRFKEYASFEGADFNGTLYIEQAKYDRLYIRWNSIKELGYDDAAYLTLLENFKKLGYVEDYDACYYEYRRLHRDQPWSGRYHALHPSEEWLRKKIDLGLQAFYGYGKKPIWPLLWSAGTILLFGLIWRRAGLDGGRGRGGIFERFSPGGEKKRKRSLDEQLCALGGAMLFSATLFLSGTRLFVDPPAMPRLEGRLAAHARSFFIAERVLGAFFSILFFLAVSGTVVR